MNINSTNHPQPNAQVRSGNRTENNPTPNQGILTEAALNTHNSLYPSILGNMDSDANSSHIYLEFLPYTNDESPNNLQP